MTTETAVPSPSARRKVAVLISGGGSNLQSLIDHAKEPDFPAEIVQVLSNKPDAYGLKRAEQAGIPTSVVEHKNHPTRESFEAEMNRILEPLGVEALCLAGFMRLLSPGFVNHWYDRILNIHPSLLPSFRGLHTHREALATGVRIAGCTVHFVRPEMDVGPIIIQAAVPVLPEDTEEALAARVLREEHRIYPIALRLWAENRLEIRNERVHIRGYAVPERALLNPPSA